MEDATLEVRIERMQLRAENHRETAAAHLAAAGRAEAAARRLAAYRDAICVFADDRLALDIVDRLIVDWTGTGAQLVDVVRALR
ncbi:hypothetical protein [Blastococcus sp. SYSU DS1024]